MWLLAVLAASAAASPAIHADLPASDAGRDAPAVGVPCGSDRYGFLTGNAQASPHTTDAMPFMWPI